MSNSFVGVLPPVASIPQPHQHAQTTNQLVKIANRQDTFAPIFGTDTGSATAYAIAPVPGLAKSFYRVGQIFTFKAANANTTGVPTFNANGLGAGTITYPDGSALLPGDIAANGFYTVEVTSTTPTFQLLSAAGGHSKLLQTVSVETGAVATGTTTIPFDDTIPQNTEGDQYMSLSITPKSATSKLIIDVVVNLANSAASGNIMTATLLQDSTANALAAAWQINGGANFVVSIAFRHIMTSGTTSATTFKVRAGLNVAGTTTFNGQAAGRIYGGVLASSIVIQEVLP